MYLILLLIFIILLVLKYLVSLETLDAIWCILLLKDDKIVKDELYELASMSTLEILEKRNYPAEIHKVTTEDGYILEMHRIPGGKDRKGPTKPPVFFMHGLQANSTLWVVQEDRLAYQLADLGYDIWPGNARGTNYSRAHKSLDTNSSEFWNFSINEIGVFDVPAMIDYILMKTNQKSLYYVGSSQGTATSYIMLSKKPEYNKKIRLVVSFTPIVCMKNSISFQIYGHPISQLVLQGMAYIFGETGHFANSKSKRRLIIPFQLWRSNSKQILSFCDWYTGKTKITNFDMSLLPVMFSHIPAGASYKQLRHFGQFVRTGVFGEFLNSKDYWSGKTKPYEIKNVTAPVALFYAENDNIVVMKDAEETAAKLPNVVFKHLIPEANHVDHIFAKDANETHYKHVISLFNKY